MAILNNDNRAGKGSEGKNDTAHDEAGMMSDAKEYTKRDVSTVIKLFEKLSAMDSINIADIPEELIVKTLLQVKYEQIDKARNHRPTYMSYLD